MYQGTFQGVRVLCTLVLQKVYFRVQRNFEHAQLHINDIENGC